MRKRNEDCCLVARVNYAHVNRSNFSVAMVCDGLGGMSHGREAAILAASAFTAHLFCATSVSLEGRLSQAITYVNKQVYKLLHGDGGTTFSAVISTVDGAMFCHVGDSRIYGIMPDRTLEQLSRDDTISALLKRQEGEGEAPKDSRLLQFVGMGDEMEAQIVAVPSHCRSILLTSDGAHDIPYSVLQRVVSAAAGGSDLIRKLLTLADMTGGRDNASAILLPIGSEVELYDQTGGNELLAILPSETLTIQFTGLGEWDAALHTQKPPPHNQAGEPSRRIEEAPASADVVNSELERKSDATKSKGKTMKAGKPKRSPARPKANAADRLPLEQHDNKVDVEFSTPDTKPDEEKQ